MARVDVTIENHIARVTLTRGDKMNAVDPDMAQAIIAAGEQILASTDDIRAVVISGEGRAFCAGLDVASFAKLAGEDPVARIMPRTFGPSNDFQHLVMVWRKIEVPVIAALHGVAFGAGFQLAIGADIRICHPDTKLAIMEMKWGLVPDMGGMAILPHLTRTDVIRRMTYTAEPISAQQAFDWGLVTELNDAPAEAAMALATTIASQSPSAMRAAKRLITVAETADETLALYEESREQAALVGGKDQLEVIASNMAGRAPDFG